MSRFKDMNMKIPGIEVKIKYTDILKEKITDENIKKK